MGNEKGRKLKQFFSNTQADFLEHYFNRIETENKNLIIQIEKKDQNITKLIAEFDNNLNESISINDKNKSMIYLSLLISSVSLILSIYNLLKGY